jgi:hypothetical protein
MRTVHRKRLLAGACLLVLGVSAAVLWRTSAAAVVPKGYDEFQSSPGALTYEDWELPGEFFVKKGGSRSKPVSARVAFTAGAAVHGFSADTVIERLDDVRVPGATRVQVIGRRLVSASPLTVAFDDGTTVHYEITVKESSKLVSKGRMEFFTSNEVAYHLDVNREYLCVSNGQPARVFDSTDLGWDPVRLSARGKWAMIGREVRVEPLAE